MTIARVQGNAQGLWSSGSSFTVVMGTTPTAGNIIVLVIGTYSGSKTVSSVTQTGVTWSGSGNGLQASKLTTTADVEIWIGTVGAGAGTTITINLSGTPSYGAIGNACEYSGLAAASLPVLDKTATASGTGVTSSTGTTATTTLAAELWVGGIAVLGGSYSNSQSAPTNSFALLDGVAVKLLTLYVSLGFLEKIVSGTGTANSGTTCANGGYSGAIATFKGSTIVVPTVTTQAATSLGLD